MQLVYRYTEEWRNGSAGKKGFLDPLGEAFMNLVASVGLHRLRRRRRRRRIA
jgi:hypothetical protein